MPRKGANAFVVLADNSQSLLIKDDQASHHPGRLGPRPAQEGVALEDPDRPGLRRPQLRLRLPPPGRRELRRPRLRRHRLGARRPRSGRPVEAIPGAPAGRRPAVHRRQPDRPRRPRPDRPPADLPGDPSRREGRLKDVGVREVSVSQTNFESAPVVVRADVSAVGFDGQADRRGRARRGRQGGRPPGAQGDLRRQAARLPLPVPAREEGRQLLQGRRLRRLGRVEREEGDDRRSPSRRADPGQQHAARRGRPGGRAVPRALRRRPAELGVQVPPPGLAGGRAGQPRRPAPDRQAAGEVRLPGRRLADDLAPLQRLRQRRPRHRRGRRPAGPGPPRHGGRGRAARRLPQDAPRSFIATTPSSSTTSRPRSSPRISSPSSAIS